MAEAVAVAAVFGVLQEIVGGGLGSGLTKGFGLIIRGVDGELEKLQSNFSAIQAVLSDAEERRVKNKTLEDWLKKVRDVAYRVDNVLDEFHIEALRRREAENGNHMLKNVRDFFSGSNPVIFKFRMGRKLKEVGVRLDIIAKERRDFHLNEQFGGPLAGTGGGARIEIVDCETSSFIADPVYGRDEDREKVVKFLKADISNDEDVISVISIVGMGGIGKTTLAKLAYHDAAVKSAFDIQKWVCVSEDFNVTRLTRMMMKSTTGAESMEQLQHLLREELNGMKLLLVLDDVWNEDSQRWSTLRGFLRICAKGSKIIVTTRSENVATIMGSVDSHILGALTDDDCWKLFEKLAFHGRIKEEYAELVSIGQEIVKKCDGLPMAAKVLGSLMSSKKTKSEWMAIEKSEIWQLQNNDILPALMLSYYNLPSYLKPCFAYCALFPKDSKIEENTFIWLWMAEGLILSHSYRSTQDIGKEYLRELVSRSLFQSDGSYYSVHDLVHDLAKYIVGDACTIVQGGESINIPQYCHCLTFIHDLNISTSPKEFYQTETLRTLLFFRNSKITEVPRKMFDSLSKLRALDFSGCSIRELSDSIGSLKHLKYINLSCASIKVVPQSICSLQNLYVLVLQDADITTLPASIGHLLNLQVLDLSGCPELRSLPASIGDLQNLNVLLLNSCESLQTLPASMTRLQKLDSLELDYCYNLQELPTGLSNMTNLREMNICCCSKLTHMPMEMGKLTKLQKLLVFIADEERGSSIAELGHLKDLGGELEILNLGKLKDPRVARNANLKEKRNIHTLYLLEGEIKFVDDVAVEVLEGLEPPHNIMKLHMNGGTEFPGWLKLNMTESSFPNLIDVTLENFRGCKYLPPLGQLKHLETLAISGMGSIEVVGREFCGNNGGGAFPSLKEIKFKEMPKWKIWLSSEEDGNIGQQTVAFTQLTHLKINKCPGLTSLPCLPCLTELKIDECPGLTLLPCLPCLPELTIGKCPRLTSLPCLPCLTRLHICECPGLTSLPCLPCLTELNIDECPGLTSLPCLPCLTELNIDECPGLTSLPCLPCLTELNIDECPGLTSLPCLPCLTELNIDECLGLTSLPCLPCLTKLWIRECPGLTSLPCLPCLTRLQTWECLGLTSLPCLPCLTGLTIGKCPGLTSLPCLPCLTRLQIWECPGLTSLPCLPCLTGLTIRECPGLTSLPSLPCLTELRIDECHGLKSLPCLPSLQVLIACDAMKLLKSAGSLRELGVGSLKRLKIYGKKGEDVRVMEGLRHLSRVEDLEIGYFDEVDCVMESMRHLFSTVQNLTILCTEGIRVLPETIVDLVSLQSLHISFCDSLSSLGKGFRGLTALRDLTIRDCKELGCMPEYMGSLTSLQSLSIRNCPHLSRRCERDKGEDWHLISHIPNIYIDQPEEEEETDNPQSKKKAISVVKERLSACFPSTTSST